MNTQEDLDNFMMAAIDEDSQMTLPFGRRWLSKLKAAKLNITKSHRG